MHDKTAYDKTHDVDLIAREVHGPEMAHDAHKET